MNYRVIITPAAQNQLEGVFAFVSTNAGTDVAERFTRSIIDFCKGLANFPARGNRRDDLAPGLRVTNFRKTTTICFSVESDEVVIHAIAYAGQDMGALVRGLD